MSFILDALKKIERQKKAEDHLETDGQPVMEGGRRWGETSSRISFTLAGVVVVALAALVIAGLALIQAYRTDRPVDSAAPPKVTEGGKASVAEQGEEDLWPKAALSPPARSKEVGAEKKESLPVLPVEPEKSEVLLEEKLEIAHPVRLSGQSDEGYSISEEEPLGVHPPSQAPEGAPELILQGTSIVDGRPVAVVNFHRLFEGDIIEGARVIRIFDRRVELEFEGKRFVIEF